MSINKIDARHRIKRSILPGVTPTVPPSTDFTDGTWLNTDIRAAEFFYNIPDQKLWIGTDTGSIEIPLLGGSAPTLSQVLNADNETGSHDILISSGQALQSTNFLTSLDAGGYLSLDYSNSPGAVLLSVDLGAYDKGQLYMEPGYIELSTYASGGLINLYTNNSGITVNDPSMFAPYYLSMFGDIDYFYGKQADANPAGNGTMILIGDTTSFSLTAAASGLSAGLILNSFNGANISTPSVFSTIISSSGGTINGDHNVLISASSCAITGNNNIVSGNQNINSAGSNNITCGNSNENQTSNSILTGVDNIMSNPGVMYSSVNSGTDIGSNGFSSVGERTTNATPKNLSVVGSSAATNFKVPTDTAFRIHLTILATAVATGDCKEWEGFGIIKNLSGTTSLVAAITPTSTVGDVSLATATVTVAAGGVASDDLLITGVGIAATTINWICGIKYDKIIIA